MPYRHSGHDDDNLEVYVKVPVPKPSSSRTIIAALIGAVAVILAALIPIALANNNSSTQTSVSTPTPTLEQSATVLIEQYFSDINNKDYQDAYNIWKDTTDKPSLPNFEKAYATTLNDAVTVKNATVQNDGTVKVSVTLQATDQLPSGTGTKTNNFTGYYIVGPQNGVLKILYGQLS